jgi:hypothetical protein
LVLVRPQRGVAALRAFSLTNEGDEASAERHASADPPKHRPKAATSLDRGCNIRGFFIAGRLFSDERLVVSALPFTLPVVGHEVSMTPERLICNAEDHSPRGAIRNG